MDTVSFDTVFTTIGSTTKYFTVKNPENQTVILSNIQLAGTKNTPFRLNINGIGSNQAADINLPAKDSLYIFVEVTVDPNGQNLPLVVADSILFNVNGNTQSVQLIAFGQDVHLLNGQRIQTENWKNDKPYLIFNSVLIDSLQTLTIDAGCRIHFHKNSSMLVKGTLKASGSFEEPIVFQGDRLGKEYENIPGQWGYTYQTENKDLIIFGGIHFFQGSKDNLLNYVTIRNADKGIQLDSMGFSSKPMLTISNSRIENMTLNCIDARTSNIDAWNCIFANSGYYTVALAFGGDYRFYHCTFANYFAATAQASPALLLNNYFEYNKKTYGFDLNAEFGNSIFYGYADSQISTDQYQGNSFVYSFKNCLLKTGGDKSFTGNSSPYSSFDKDPMFAAPNNFCFSVDSLSPARNIGNIDIAKLYPFDMNNIPRLADEGPDLGALEWVSSK
ncbi:MAG: hypothetical protein ACK5HT_00690 [Draconibacterium sp.]